MSHIEEGKTTLTFTTLAALIARGDEQALQAHPCLALLRQALTLIAQAEQGEVTATYSNYRYRPQSTNTHLALTIPGKLPRGIGLVIEDTGALIFKGDPWEHRAFFEEVQQRIVQNYVVLAHAAALRRLNAQVSTQIVEQQIVITGVFHGR